MTSEEFIINAVKDYGLVPVAVLFLLFLYMKNILPGHVVEKIKHSHWINQRQWGAKEKLYMDILGQLTIMHVAFEDCVDCYDHGSYDDGSSPSTKHYSDSSIKGHDALQKIRELIGPAAVFLSQSAMQALRELISDAWMSTEVAVTPYEYMSWLKQASQKAYDLVLVEAKNSIGEN